MIHVRPYIPADREFVLNLVPRFACGIPPWRDPHRWLATSQRRITEGIEQQGQRDMVFVAEDERGELLGFAIVAHDTHFTGEPHAYLAELATSEAAEGQGAGKALISACEQWARKQGYPLLALTVGAVNERALGFYRHLGYIDDDIMLVKRL